jgi:translation initiation factor 3 subunit M
MALDNQSQPAIDAIVSAIVTLKEKSSFKLKVLSNLFNSSKASSKLDIFNAILTVAKDENELDAIAPILKKVDLWLDEWQVDQEQRAQVYLYIAECGFDSTYTFEFILKYLSINQDEEYARNAIKLALNIPSVLLFENVSNLDAVKNLTGDLVELLDIFSTKTLSEYNAFIKKHPNVLKENGLESEKLLTKMRLLTLDSLAISNVGKKLGYDAIAKTLDIPVEKVEFWVIDGIID